MNKFIVFTVVLVAIWGAGAEPPQYRTFKYVHPAPAPAVQPQFGQQQAAASGPGYDTAGPPSGQLLLLPGEYVVQVNSPYREYGAPEQAQFVPQPAAVGQYNYQQQQFSAAQDPNFFNNGQQFGQYTAQQGQYKTPGQQTSQASGQFGQYNGPQRQYNAPGQQASQEAGQYNEQQFGQYNANFENQQQQFEQRVAPKQSPAPFGQLKVQKGKFSGELNVGEQAEVDADEQQDEPQEDQPQVTAKAQRGNIKYNKQSTQPEQVDEQYQQGRYVQRGNARYTSPKSQVELIKTNGNQQQAEAAQNNAENDDDDDEEAEDNQEFSGKYTQSKSGKYTAPSQQEQPQYVPSRTFFFGRYTQPSDSQQAEVQSDYSKVSKYVPPKARGKSTTETPEGSATTEESNDSTTEVGPTVAYDPEAKENYTNDKEDEEENTKAANGYYYLLLPDGKLQKIVYMTEEDLKKMAFVARLQYQNVEPIQGPVYSYNPENSPFVQVF